MNTYIRNKYRKK